jgi:glycosyltransferase involved in cell wall biosynthesis
MLKAPRAIVSVTNDLYTDNRVDKICLFLVGQGYEVILVGRRRKTSLDLDPRLYKTHRMKLLFDKGPFFYAAYNIRLFLYLLFRRADLLVANDLDTLLANYVAGKFKSSTRLVYDSHEYYTEVPELTGRPRIKAMWEGIEKRIFPKLKWVYTVNQSIADRYSEKYGVPVKVVRNIAPKYQAEEAVTRSVLGLPEDKFILILQGAGINMDRGAEELVEAMRLIENALLLIIGDGDVLPQLQKDVIEYDLQETVLFLGKKPYKEMMRYTHVADVGLTLDKSTNLNYRFSLPNKVFDYIHAGTPVICTDLPEVKKVVQGHEVGIVLKELSPQMIAKAVEDLRNDPVLYQRLKTNCHKAALIESWEGECEILKSIYPRVGK